MQYVLYIGAALVIGLLIGFIALSVAWLRKSMLRNVRSHTLGLLSVYDDLLEEKSRELSALNEQIRIRAEESAAQQTAQQTLPSKEEAPQGVSPSTLLAITEQAAEASYRDDAVGLTYHQIRENFSFDMNEILPAVPVQTALAAGPAGETLRELSYESVYQLSTLTEKDQLEVLSACLSQQGCALLDEYLQEHPHFGVLAFYDYLISRQADEPREARLYVPEGTPAPRVKHGTVDIAVDSGICEGFQLEMDGKLYDYSIKTKELCE